MNPHHRDPLSEYYAALINQRLISLDAARRMMGEPEQAGPVTYAQLEGKRYSQLAPTIREPIRWELGQHYALTCQHDYTRDIDVVSLRAAH
jgi:hypothetical protein